MQWSSRFYAPNCQRILSVRTSLGIAALDKLGLQIMNCRQTSFDAWVQILQRRKVSLVNTALQTICALANESRSTEPVFGIQRGPVLVSSRRFESPKLCR